MSQPRARLIAACAAVLGMLAAAAAAEAVELKGSIFAVRDVAVDTTAATAAAAREQAIASGERSAFERLLARLTLASDAQKLPQVDATQLADLTEGFEIQAEKNSPVRYIASLTFRFKPRAVETLLRSAGIGFAETPSKPVVVLPVWHAADGVMLWEDANPWRAAWANLPAADGLVPFIAPLGDLEDLAAIDAKGAAEGDAQKLAVIAARYGAGATLVAVAKPVAAKGDKPASLDLAVQPHGAAAGAATTVSSVAALPGETPEAHYARAALNIEIDLAEHWKADNLLHFDQAQTLAVVAPIDSLAEWLAIRNRLAQVASVSRAELLYLARDEARLSLSYLGEEAQLKLALAQHDLSLSEEEGGAAVLRLSGGGTE